MNNDEKLLKAIETLQTDVKGIKADVSTIKTEHGKRLDRIEVDATDIKTEQKKQFKAISKKISKVQKDIELVLKYEDEQYLKHEKRIQQLEHFSHS